MSHTNVVMPKKALVYLFDTAISARVRDPSCEIRSHKVQALTTCSTSQIEAQNACRATNAPFSCTVKLKINSIGSPKVDQIIQVKVFLLQ